MTLYIGRNAIPSDPDVIGMDGDTLSLTFDLDTTEVTSANRIADMKYKRHGLLGIANNADEPVIPFTWDQDATFDGFYIPEGISVPSTPAMLGNGYVPGCTAQLRRIQSFYTPQFEVVAQVVTRSNPHGVTVPVPVILPVPNSSILNEWLPADYVGMPALTTIANRSHQDVSPNLGGFASTTNNNATQYGVAASASGALYSWRYSTPPSRYYTGCCSIYGVDAATGLVFPIVGRKVPRLTKWYITNGIVRLTSGDGANEGTIDVWNGAAWETAQVRHYMQPGSSVFAIGGHTTGGIFSRVAIVKNSPELVIVRCYTPQVTFTYTIKRGDRFVECSWQNTQNANSPWGIEFVGKALTTLTGCAYASAVDANGNRVTVGSDIGHSLTVVGGGGNVYHPTVAAQSGRAYVGVIFNGQTTSGSVPFEGPLDIRDQFLGAVVPRQRVVVT